MHFSHQTPPPFGQLLMIGLPEPALDEETALLIRDHGVGNFILFARNVIDPPQLQNLCRDLVSACTGAGLPWPLLAIDQEGGAVRRLKPPHWPALPANEDVGLGPSPQAAALAQAVAAAEMLRPLGIRLNLAPVLDVAPCAAQGVLAGRCYGADPERVAALGAAYIETLQANGIGATAKHFPGIGRATQDPHLARPVVYASRDTLEQDMAPFRAAVDIGVMAVMTSHVVFPSLDPERPVTFSRAVCEGVLREELGFGGLVLSDDLEMGGITAHGDVAEAAVQSVLAGHDLLLVCHRADRVKAALSALSDAWRSGALPLSRIDASLSRLEEARGLLGPPG